MNSEPTVASILDDYLDQEATAAELGISIHTLDKWHQLRKGPPRTVIARKVYYRRESLRQWVLAQEKTEVCAAS